MVKQNESDERNDELESLVARSFPRTFDRILDVVPLQTLNYSTIVFESINPAYVFLFTIDNIALPFFWCADTARSPR